MAALLTAFSTAWAQPDVTAFLERHCLECHDADVKKGGLDLAALPLDVQDQARFQTWQRVFERVQSGEMPPKKKTPPAPEEMRSFLAKLEQPLLAADRADIAAHGRVRGRRLTRAEYEHTLHDLLGIDLPLKELLPEDRASHGFETVSDGQQLSHHQLARYLDVADLALEDAFSRALKGDAPFSRFTTVQDTAKNLRGNYRGPDVRGGRSITWPITLQFFGRMEATRVPAGGWYRITLKDVQAINPGPDGVVWGTLRSGECESNAPMLYMIGLVEATPEPRDLVFQAWIQETHRLELRPNDGENRNAPTGAKGGNVSFKDRNLEKEGYRGIAHRGILMERIHPNGTSADVRRALFDQVDPTQGTPADVDRLVARFARRAFRRPTAAEHLRPYQELARAALAEGTGLPEALRTAYRAMLCSPRFLTLVEPPGPLDDHAIAARLALALWLGLPDATLDSLADQGKLREPTVLAAQVERMLADARAERFIHSFTDQWLKLKEIDFTTPDPRQFRSFDAVLQHSMLQETRAYFAEMLRADLPISHLVESDFAFLNGRLVRHYLGGLVQATAAKDKKRKEKDADKAQEKSALSPILTSIGLTPGQGLQKVTLPPGSHRGGLVTQGAVLKVTADGTTTSPVVRGVFINERILGTHIPPPPPGVPAIEPDIRGATSIRDQLAKHRSNESCASCHRTIDPPGFALESYDPVGAWRTNYGGGRGAKVDPSGQTPDGLAFADLSAWKAIYQQRQTQLARGFAAHFLTYASGAAPRFSDAPTLDTLAAKTTHLRAIIREVICSEIFLKK
ncbi:MAG: DUF1592 domain-containing protein [Prosthecobacter sp.]|nr:DUF1592 domain-containing protein [Prosthecobacter sp.]